MRGCHSNVWIGGGAIVCPGAMIGANRVIGAGSVVTRDIPADVVAVGNLPGDAALSASAGPMGHRPIRRSS